VTCLVPEGVAREQVAAFLGAEAGAGAAATRGALTVRVMPFVPQPDYDRLLWACDLNFVRGEDSWVRAQWAASPSSGTFIRKTKTCTTRNSARSCNVRGDIAACRTFPALEWRAGSGRIGRPVDGPASRQGRIERT
jgi:hypothetical protein